MSLVDKLSVLAITGIKPQIKSIETPKINRTFLRQLPNIIHITTESIKDIESEIKTNKMLLDDRHTSFKNNRERLDKYTKNVNGYEEDIERFTDLLVGSNSIDLDSKTRAVIDSFKNTLEMYQRFVNNCTNTNKDLTKQIIIYTKRLNRCRNALAQQQATLKMLKKIKRQNP